MPQLFHQDVLDQWQRQALGDALQLRLPLRSKADLVRVSVILREFSARLEALGKRQDTDDFSALMQAKIEGKAAQGRLSSRLKEAGG